MNEITQKLKTLILILSQAEGFSYINQSALNSLGWSIDDLNKNFPHISKLSSNLNHFEKFIYSLVSGDYDNYSNNTNLIQRQELEIFGQSYNCYFQKYDANYILELNPIIYQDLNQATHEFKRPIQNIKTLVEVLIMGAKNDNNKLDEYLLKLNTEADRLSALVGNMLSLSRLNSGFQEVYKSTINLHQMIKIIFETLANFADSKEIQLHNLLPVDTSVSADKKLLEHALSNLIDNAIKYNVKKGFVKVYTILDGFVIEDSGFGMNKEESLRIFEQFYRIPDRLEIQGSGLGLSLVKKIIDLHGWSISVDSEPGKGTRFYLKFNNSGPGAV